MTTRQVSTKVSVKVDGWVSHEERVGFNTLVAAAVNYYKNAMKDGELSAAERKELISMLTELNRALAAWKKDMITSKPEMVSAFGGIKNVLKKETAFAYGEKDKDGEWTRYNQLGRLRLDDVKNSIKQLVELESELANKGFIGEELVRTTLTQIDRMAINFAGAAQTFALAGYSGRANAVSAGAVYYAGLTYELNELSGLNLEMHSKQFVSHAREEAVGLKKKQQLASWRAWRFRGEFALAFLKDCMTNESTREFLAMLYTMYAPEIEKQWEIAKNQPVWKTALNIYVGEYELIAKAAVWFYNQMKFAVEKPGEAAVNVGKFVFMYDLWEPVTMSYMNAMENYISTGKMPDLNPTIFQIKMAACMTAFVVATVGAGKAAALSTKGAMAGIRSTLGRFASAVVKAFNISDWRWISEVVKIAEQENISLLKAMLKHPPAAGCSVKIVGAEGSEELVFVVGTAKGWRMRLREFLADERGSLFPPPRPHPRLKTGKFTFVLGSDIRTRDVVKFLSNFGEKSVSKECYKFKIPGIPSIIFGAKRTLRPLELKSLIEDLMHERAWIVFVSETSTLPPEQLAARLVAEAARKDAPLLIQFMKAIDPKAIDKLIKLVRSGAA